MLNGVVEIAVKRDEIAGSGVTVRPKSAVAVSPDETSCPLAPKKSNGLGSRVQK